MASAPSHYITLSFVYFNIILYRIFSIVLRKLVVEGGSTVTELFNCRVCIVFYVCTYEFYMAAQLRDPHKISEIYS